MGTARHRIILTMLFLALGLLAACAQNTPIPDEEIDSADRLARIKTDLGIEYMKEGRNDIALRRLLEALQLEPDYVPALTALGLLYTNLEEIDAAEKQYRRALRIAPDNPSALNNYGLFLCQQDQVDGAITMFTRATDNPLYRTPEIAHSNAGTCLVEAGRTEEAEQSFRTALQINAKLPPALLQMSELSLGLERHLSARAYLQRYHEVARQSAKSLWLGIRIERFLDDKDTLSSYELLLEKSYPDTEEARLLLKSRQAPR